jgi:hypothetical protein
MNFLVSTTNYINASEIILKRIKYQLGMKGYSDISQAPTSMVTAIDTYGMGHKRPLSQFIEMTGINFATEKVASSGYQWCIEGKPPLYKVGK